MTIRMTTIEAKENFAETLNQVTIKKEQIILMRRGKEVAALVPLEDFYSLETSKNKQELQEASESLKEARLQGSVSLEQITEEINN